MRGLPLSCRHTTPTFSIIVEWENARFAELVRTRRMLRALREQLLALSPLPAAPPEIILLYDRHTIDGALVQQVMEEEFQPASVPVDMRIVPSDGLRYYQQKNEGARISAGTTVKIFLDCDVVPEPGWLDALLDALEDPRVDVVAGETYIEYTNFYSKAFALFWFFSLRDSSEDLRPATMFHANNVAFRADVFAQYPFPDLDTYRSQCTLLGDRLRANGHGLFVQKRARVSHPCPQGIGYFIARALNNGRDEFLVRALREPRYRPRKSGLWHTFRSGIAMMLRRLRHHGAELGLGPLGRASAFCVAFAYFGLKALGEALTRWNPAIVPRFFRI